MIDFTFEKIGRLASSCAFYLILAVCVLTFVAGLAGCAEGDDDDEDAGDGDTGDDDTGDDDTAGDDDDDNGPWVWPDCPEVAGTQMTLAEKAAEFDRLSREWHIAGDGLLRPVTLTEDLSQVATYNHTPNTILWSGMYLASQAFRYAVTGEQEAVENARVIVAAMRHLTDVTGVSGLYGRSMVMPGVAYNYYGEGHASWIDSTAPGYEGWRYNNDVSQDGYAGMMFGYSAAMQHFDDEQLVADVEQLVREVVEHVVGNGLQIIDADGEVTEHGRLFQSALDDFPGFNAMMSSSWIRVGLDATGDEALADFYYGCLMFMRGGVECPAIENFYMSSYIDSMEQLMGLFVPFCQQNYDNFDMMFQAVYPLLTREDDPVLHQRLMNVLRNNMYTRDIDPIWQVHTMDEIGNSFFTFIYAGLTGDPPTDPLTFRVINDAACTLKRFPEDKHQRHLPEGRQTVECLNRLDVPNAAEMIPLEERYFDNYLWRLDPYEILTTEQQENPRYIHSPEDYLVAYWMGRYYGFLKETQ